MRGRWHWLIPAGVIACLLAPIPLTDRTFASDWGNHLWLIWVQGLSIGEHGSPSYFLDFNLGAFYPYYAFYGGSMYAVLGGLSQLFDPDNAVLLAYAAALAAAYLGWTWIAMQAGVRGWPAQLPGAIAVTTPYAISNLYGRGDIPESIATAMIPLVAASALAIVREPRVRLPAAVAYVASVAVLTGTHTLTLVWGGLFLVLGAALLTGCYWQAARERGRRALTLVWLGALGLGVNAWILVPLILYHGRLLEAEPASMSYTLYTHPDNLFSLLRDSGDLYANVTADVNTQLPLLALLWVLIGGALFWRNLSSRDRRLAIGLLGLLGGFMVLMLAPPLIEVLPRTLRFIQFPYRLLTYADLCIVGLITLALAAMQRAGSAARVQIGLLAAIAALSFGLSMAQILEARSFLSGRDEALASSVQTPPSWYAPLQFADGSGPIVKPTLSQPVLLPVERPGQERYSVSYPAGPAGTAATNILTGTYFVDVKGARPVGRTAEGAMVVRLPASPSRPRQVTVSASWGTAVTIGRWLTIASLVLCLALLGLFGVKRNRRTP